MRLRLYHHRDGARVAYRETGAGRALVLLHSLGLSHREWEPVVESLARRFRVVLPDLPLHGDSEDDPRYSYRPEWMVEVMAGFCAEVAGARPLLAGHDLGGDIALALAAGDACEPRRLVLMPSRLQSAPRHLRALRAGRLAFRLAAVPGLDRLLARAAPLVFRPALGERLSHQRNPAARDLVRHALADLPANHGRARAWARFARAWPLGGTPVHGGDLRRLAMPVLLLWAEEDPAYPLEIARTALPLLPDGQLRTLPDAGFLLAYDDPVGVARELIAFCG